MNPAHAVEALLQERDGAPGRDDLHLVLLRDEVLEHHLGPDRMAHPLARDAVQDLHEAVLILRPRSS